MLTHREMRSPVDPVGARSSLGDVVLTQRHLPAIEGKAASGRRDRLGPDGPVDLRGDEAGGPVAKETVDSAGMAAGRAGRRAFDSQVVSVVDVVVRREVIGRAPARAVDRSV